MPENDKAQVKMKTQIHYKLYQHMASLGVEHFKIYLVENYPCQSKEELRAKEGEWIKKLGTLNDRIAGRDGRQWYEENREEHLQKCKEYRVENTEKVKQREIEYRNRNIEKIRERDRQRYKEHQKKENECKTMERQKP